MIRNNVEHDLLNILKYQRGEDVIYTILNMVNGTYKYEYSYLNKIPYDEMMIYLEKVIVLGTNSKSELVELEYTLDAIMKFADRVQFIEYSDLDKNTNLSKKYNLLIKKEKLLQLKNNFKKPIVKKGLASLVLACTLFFTLCDKKDKKIVTKFMYVEPEVQMELITNTEMFEKKELTNDEKLQEILEMYNLTENEFNVVCAVVFAESKANSYEDAYAVINTIYNRTISKNWVGYISNIYGGDAGKSLYYQATAKGQFVVYQTGIYQKYLYQREGDKYQAVIDFLYNKEIMHNYLSFRSSNTSLNNYVQFVQNGNKYFNALLEDDRIIEEEIVNKR